MKLWWFRFYIDPDSKIDALQAAAKHPPKGKRQIVALIRELVDDDVVEFRPEVPLLAAFGGQGQGGADRRGYRVRRQEAGYRLDELPTWLTIELALIPVFLAGIGFVVWLARLGATVKNERQSRID